MKSMVALSSIQRNRGHSDATQMNGSTGTSAQGVPSTTAHPPHTPISATVDQIEAV